MRKNILLICPSNLCYMPYARHYLEALNDLGVDYDIIYWDRFKLNENNNWLRYSDNKFGHARGFIDYILFSSFVKKSCASKKYNRVVLFGVQLAFFLSDFIRSNFKGNYIWDIRDYHFLAKFFNLENFVRSSNFVAISSPGFLDWLPRVSKYMTCHNLHEGIRSDALPLNSSLIDSLVISYIGALRDFNLHSSFIKNLSNSSKINLRFHGRGTANEALTNFISKNNIDNAAITNHYDPKDENLLYDNATMINALVPNIGVNNKSLLPNRLYRSIINKRPVIALNGTRTASIVSQYRLGLVLDKIEGCENEILDFIYTFDSSIFSRNSKNFINDANSENIKFRQHLIDFMEN